MSDETEVTTEDAEERMDWPVPLIPLPGVFDVQPSISTDGTPIVIIALYHPAGAAFVQFAREDALLFASMIKKVAQTGPTLES